jgi:hypothetical protein
VIKERSTYGINSKPATILISDQSQGKVSQCRWQIPRLAPLVVKEKVSES